jgi:hypothetical protein
MQRFHADIRSNMIPARASKDLFASILPHSLTFTKARKTPGFLCVFVRVKLLSFVHSRKL